jgi:hypothetical protein
MPSRRAERRIREWLSHLIPVPLPDVPENNRICTLCYEAFPALEEGGDYPVRVRSTNENATCQHVFGRMCIEEHLSSGREYSRKCPICRANWFGDTEGEALGSVHEEAEESAAAAAHRQRSRFRTPGATPEDRRLELLFGLDSTNEHDRQQFFAAMDRTLLGTSLAAANVHAIDRSTHALADTDERLRIMRDIEADGAVLLRTQMAQGVRHGSAEEDDVEMERRPMQAGLRQAGPTASDALPQPTAPANLDASDSSRGNEGRLSHRGSQRRDAAPVLRRPGRLSGDGDDAMLPSVGRIMRTIGFLEQLRRTEELVIDSSDIVERVDDVERAVDALWRSVDDDGRRRRRIRFVRRDS